MRFERRLRRRNPVLGEASEGPPPMRYRVCNTSFRRWDWIPLLTS